MRDPQLVDFLKWLALLIVAVVATTVLLLVCPVGGIWLATPTLIPTPTSTLAPTSTRTPTPTVTHTRTPSPTFTSTSTSTSTSTATPSPSATATATTTATPTSTSTHTPTYTPTRTPVPTRTPTRTRTPTPTIPPWREVLNWEEGYAILVPGVWQGVAAAQDANAISRLLISRSPELAKALNTAIDSGILTNVSFVAVDPESGATMVVLVGRAMPGLPVGMLLSGLMGQFRELEGYAVLDTNLYRVSGVTGALTEFTFDVGDDNVLPQQHGLQLFVPARRATFVVILVGTHEQFDDLQPTFEEIISGFRLLN